VLVIALLVPGRLWSRRDSGSGSREVESPMDILKKRYARGEIIREDFERMKRDLT
jgi:putative membrane protein